MRPATKAVAVTAFCWLVLGFLGVVYAGESGPGAVDGALRDAVLAVFSPGVLRVLLAPTDTPVQFGLAALGVAVFLWLRLPRSAVALVIAPVLAMLLCEAVLKPLIDRHYGAGFAGSGGDLILPSGHTTALASLLCVLVLALPEATGTAGRWWAGAAVLVLVCAAIGLVGLRYHYPADVLAGVSLALGVSTPCWWLVSGGSRSAGKLVRDGSG